MRILKKITLLFLLLFCFQLSAQKLENAAKKLTDEMAKVMSLNAEETKAIYKIELNKRKEDLKIKEKFADQPELKKQKLKTLGGKTYQKFKKLIGNERLKKWNLYKKQK